jgi:hypothetical protein
MVWIFISLWGASSSQASYQQDYLKLKICNELRINRRDMPIENCFNGKFKFTRRGELTDFRWRLRKGAPVCTGTIYDDAGSIHLDDGCDQ